MFLLTNRLCNSLCKSSYHYTVKHFLVQAIPCIRFEHTTINNNQNDSNKKSDTEELYEIYKGKKRKLVFNEDSKSIQPIQNSLFSSKNLSFKEIKKSLQIKLGEIFLPRNYPSSVKGKYLSYCTFAALGMGLSAAGGVLSTQSIFAVGMGAGAIPMAAALNWVLKDGLGQLGGMAFTALVNSRLDADSRGWRILTAWLLEISTWLEVMTPLFPQHFLLLATLANIGKNISWLAGSATRAGIRYGFVNAHNMSDLTAKEGSQTTCITVFGTFLGIMLSNLIGAGHMQYVLMSSMCISAISLFCISQSLQRVSLPTLNYQRGEIVTNHYMKTSEVLSPERVASMERYYLPYLKVKGEDAMIPVVVGVPLKTVCSITHNKQDCNDFMKIFENQHYILSYCHYKQGIYRSIINHEKRNKMIIGVSLKDVATSEDQVAAYYHAHLLRKEIMINKDNCNSYSQQKELIEKTLKLKEMNYSQFQQHLIDNGWNVNDLFLEEKSQRYCSN